MKEKEEEKEEVFVIVYLFYLFIRVFLFSFLEPERRAGIKRKKRITLSEEGSTYETKVNTKMIGNPETVFLASARRVL